MAFLKGGGWSPISFCSWTFLLPLFNCVHHLPTIPWQFNEKDPLEIFYQLNEILFLIASYYNWVGNKKYSNKIETIVNVSNWTVNLSSVLINFVRLHWNQQLKRTHCLINTFRSLSIESTLFTILIGEILWTLATNISLRGKCLPFVWRWTGPFIIHNIDFYLIPLVCGLQVNIDYNTKLFTEYCWYNIELKVSFLKS